MVITQPVIDIFLNPLVGALIAARALAAKFALIAPLAVIALSASFFSARKEC